MKKSMRSNAARFMHFKKSSDGTWLLHIPDVADVGLCEQTIEMLSHDATEILANDFDPKPCKRCEEPLRDYWDFCPTCGHMIRPPF